MPAEGERIDRGISIGIVRVVARTLTELGLDIALSKVATEAERVADIFYVGKVEDPARLAQIQTRLAEALAAV